MKKILLVAISGFIFMFSSIVYAGWGNPGDLPVKNEDKNKLTFKPSKNVSIYWDVDQDNNTYAIGSKHTKGNRVFATTSATNQIYYMESDDYVNKTGSALDTVDMPSAGQSTFSGWSSI